MGIGERRGITLIVLCFILSFSSLFFISKDKKEKKGVQQRKGGEAARRALGVESKVG